MNTDKKRSPGGISGKVVTIVRHPNQSRRYVDVLDLYLSKVPPECITIDSKFYLQPLPFTLTGSHPWFFFDPVGVQEIKSMVKDMCRDGGFQGNFTNRSLWQLLPQHCLMLECLKRSSRKDQGTSQQQP